jgi:hypothetical protein
MRLTSYNGAVISGIAVSFSHESRPASRYDISDTEIATGTSEVGGWSTRELLSILDGLQGLDLVGADVGM